jgi:DNA-binding LytR/AlgR family response regulator
MTDTIRILIVEDEPPAARHLERCCRAVLKDKIHSLVTVNSFEDASRAILSEAIDLCFLDLNLRGRSGYDLLKSVVAGSFHTIIVSAHTEQAVEAFKYGVLDFIPKPFDEEDVRAALDRLTAVRVKMRIDTQYLSTRKGNRYIVFSLNDVVYFKAADVYVEVYLANGKMELLTKTMDRLEQILPARFFRVHRSYIAAIPHIQSYTRVQGGTSQVLLDNGEILPLSRRRYKDLTRVLSFEPEKL